MSAQSETSITTAKLLPWLRRAAVGALALGAMACSGSGGTDVGADSTGGSGADGTAAVTITGFKFVEPDIDVPAGAEVTWTNDDAVAHTVQDKGELFPESPDLAKGEAFSFTYERAGTYPYICGIHPSMKGTVTVS